MTKTTRCKFTCTEVKKTTAWGGEKGFLYTAVFTAVTDGSPENKSFFKYTPSGRLEVGTYTEDRFDVGKAYYLDITEAVEGSSASGAV
jgi:hypothetical protein